jgi:hypothetical protein
VLSYEHCHMLRSKTLCLKDLGILMGGRCLKNMIIVDNYDFGCYKHFENFIPIIDYVGDDNDV